jgi:hypothetical protein
MATLPAPVTLNVPASYILSLLLLAPKVDSKRRTYLQSVYFEIGEDEARAVASDGVTLGVFRLEEGGHHDPARGLVHAIVPRDAFDFLKASYIGWTVTLTFTANDTKEHMWHGEGDYAVDIQCCGTRVIAETIRDLEYAPYRNMFPSHASGVPAAYDPEILGRFRKIAQFLDKKNYKNTVGYTLRMNGNGPGVVFIREFEFVGLVMPLREGLSTREVPDWVANPASALTYRLEQQAKQGAGEEFV